LTAFTAAQSILLLKGTGIFFKTAEQAMKELENYL